MRFAKFVSIALQPIVVFFLMCTVLVYGRSATAFFEVSVFILIGTLLMSVLLVLKSWQGPETKFVNLAQSQRHDVYLAGVFGFGLASVVFGSDLLRNSEWMLMSMVTAIYFGIYLLINNYWLKVSQHVGMYVFALLTLADKVHVYYLLGLLFLPILAWSRIALKQHSWLEVIVGLLIGAICGFLFWL